MMRAVGQGHMNFQEVMYPILSIKLITSTFQVITTSLEGSRKVKLSNRLAVCRRKHHCLPCMQAKVFLKMIFRGFLNAIS